MCYKASLTASARLQCCKQPWQVGGSSCKAGHFHRDDGGGENPHHSRVTCSLTQQYYSVLTVYPAHNYPAGKSEAARISLSRLKWWWVFFQQQHTFLLIWLRIRDPLNRFLRCSLQPVAAKKATGCKTLTEIQFFPSLSGELKRVNFVTEKWCHWRFRFWPR